jgi:hypothetical protein
MPKVSDEDIEVAKAAHVCSQSKRHDDLRRDLTSVAELAEDLQ